MTKIPGVIAWNADQHVFSVVIFHVTYFLLVCVMQ